MLLRKFATSALVALAFIGINTMAEPVVDQPAPAFTAKTADGKTLNLESLKGKTVVLEWTNHECPFVIKHYDKSDNIPALQKEFTAKGIVWLQVISSAVGNQGYVEGESAIKINQHRGAAPTNTILDPEGTLGKLYGAQTTPHFFIINDKGVLVYKGGIDSIASARPQDIPKATNYVREALNAVASGKKVANASTKPYGCSVKFSS
ncbi:MAG: redoxin domain-containing protein [Gammaproteobacteria bacterium]|nr:MAG: redoxin domain-containing protein [Gammaproteobacteria bacterium]